MRKTLVISYIALALVGCDRLCKTTVNDFATVKNETARDLDLSICKGKLTGKEKIRVGAAQDGEMSLGSREEGYVAGGRASCDHPAGERRDVALSLTDPSFDLVKLCISDSKTTAVTLVDKAAVCPAGTTAQSGTFKCD